LIGWFCQPDPAWQGAKGLQRVIGVSVETIFLVFLGPWRWPCLLIQAQTLVEEDSGLTIRVLVVLVEIESGSRRLPANTMAAKDCQFQGFSATAEYDLNHWAQVLEVF